MKEYTSKEELSDFLNVNDIRIVAENEDRRI